MTIRFYQAECGDAASIKYNGTDGVIHNLFIDSGYARTFRHVLKNEIQNLIDNKEVIDLWVISHIHDDHIGGAIAYIDTVKTSELKDIVEKWLYNFPRLSPSKILEFKSANISDAKSISQGDDLAEYLLSAKMISPDFTTTSIPLNLYGLKITCLSPKPEQLIDLRSKYSPSIGQALERIEQDFISVSTARPAYDYHIPFENFDLKKWKEDDSVENASSIALLVEYQNISSLWLGDAHPSTVVNALKALRYSENNPLKCELVKMSHHGSAGNNNDELFSMIDCRDFIFSANGENKSCLPAKECIVRLLRNNRRIIDHHYNLYFTYDNDLLRNIFSVDTDEIFKKFNFTVHYMSGTKQFFY
ncbi:MAG: hypothetical protein JSR97_10200 [Verrucomicrobia bacterium]|nr:hypothetical protein [Verrucomicrobiota bacterium]